MESIRIELPHGGWWDVKPYLTRNAKRLIDRETQETAFETMARLEEKGLTMERLQELGSAGGSGDRAWGTEEEDAYLWHCSVAWSFPETISREAIGERSTLECKPVLTKMRALYVEGEEDQEGKEPSGGPSPSPNPENPSPDVTEMQSSTSVSSGPDSLVPSLTVTGESSPPDS